MPTITAIHLKIVLSILKQFVPNCEVRVFGSRCNGNVKEYSDLDLAIVGKEKIDWNILADTKKHLKNQICLTGSICSIGMQYHRYLDWQLKHAGMR
jgi:predicted nucleotidyltransferase